MTYEELEMRIDEAVCAACKITEEMLEVEGMDVSLLEGMITLLEGSLNRHRAMDNDMDDLVIIWLVATVGSLRSALLLMAECQEDRTVH